MILLLAALMATAQADELDAWTRLYDGLLAEAADNDIDTATRTYQDLTRTLGADEGLRGFTLWWLGRALESDGDLRGARSALRECVRVSYAPEPCLDLLGRVELDQAAVRTIPSTWTFDAPTTPGKVNHGFIHPWAYGDKGSIRVEDGVLVWRTRVGRDADDQLIAGLAVQGTPPHGVRFRVRSSVVDAAMRVIAYDNNGRSYVWRADVHRLPVGQWTTVDVPLRVMTDLEDPSRRLNRADVAQVALVDVSGRYDAPRVVNELLIDDFTVY